MRTIITKLVKIEFQINKSDIYLFDVLSFIRKFRFYKNKLRDKILN